MKPDDREFEPHRKVGTSVLAAPVVLGGKLAIHFNQQDYDLIGFTVVGERFIRIHN